MVASPTADGFVNDKGVIQIVTGEDPNCLPVLSQSVINFSQSAQTEDSSHTIKKREGGFKKKKSDTDEVEPMPIMKILNETKLGRQIIEFIKSRKYVDLSHQIQLMKIVHDHFSEEFGSPLMYYPTSDMKLSIAKGIVHDFPELADATGVKWGSWLTIVNTKFATLQAALPQEKKRNRKRNSSSSSTPSPAKSQGQRTSSGSSGRSAHSSPSPSTSTVNLSELDVDVNTQKAIMNSLLATATNRSVISLTLSATFSSRRKWILEAKPTFTDITDDYKHLLHYEGDMILEEFARIEPLANEQGIMKLQNIVPAILKHAEKAKPLVLQEITAKFNDATLQAIFFVLKYLPVTLTKTAVPSQSDLDHIRLYKHVIEMIPSSSLLQIAPVGTDIQDYNSLETSADRPPSPLHPYLLWLTGDRESGDLYLKIDKKSTHLGNTGPGTVGTRMLKALSVLIFAHYVFNLKYHPYLKNFFNYFEALCGISVPIPSVSRLNSTIKAISQE